MVLNQKESAVMIPPETTMTGLKILNREKKRFFLM
jgi:hypothetical protein